VFEYDSIYEEIRKTKEKVNLGDRFQRHSSFIHFLLSKSKDRKWEHNLIMAKKEARDRQQEEAEFGKKDCYVTTRYMNKLEGNKHWLAEQQQKMEQEKNSIEELYEFSFSCANFTKKKSRLKFNVKCWNSPTERDFIRALSYKASKEQHKEEFKKTYQKEYISANKIINCEKDKARSTGVDKREEKLTELLPKSICPDEKVTTARARFLARKRERES